MQNAVAVVAGVERILRRFESIGNVARWVDRYILVTTMLAMVGWQ